MAKTFSRRQNEIVSNMNSVLQNVFVLYFILILSLANMFYLVTANNYMFAAIFILTGFITSFFSKNMMVILCIALTVTNVLQFGKNAAIEEGFDDEDKPTDSIKNPISNKLVKPVKSNTNNDDDTDVEVNMDGIETQYKRLAELQTQITKNMQKITEPLEEAEGIVNNMAKTLGLNNMN